MPADRIASGMRSLTSFSTKGTPLWRLLEPEAYIDKMTKPHCFLCQPNPRLVVAQAEAAYAMVGLGPITSAYAILASMAHLRSLADVATTNPHVIEAVV